MRSLVAAVATIAAFAVLAPSASASAAPSASFAGGWGGGVVNAFQTCTSSCQSGTSGAAAGQMAFPDSAAVNNSSGNVYVADTWGSQRIDEFSATGSFIRAWGWGVSDGANQFETCTGACQLGTYGGGAGELANPQGVAVNDSSGNVYVGGGYNGRIDEFSSSGSFIQAWGWGVLDGANQFETCTTACQSGIYGGGAGQMAYPWGIAVAPSSGNVYVVDDTEDRVDEFSAGGNFIMAWGWGVSDGADQLETCTTSCQSGIAGSGAGQLSAPEGVAINSSTGNVYVADSGNQRIDEFSSSGGFVQAWGWGVSDGANEFETCTTSCQSGITGGAPGQFNEPTGVGVGSGSGNVFVTDGNNQRIDEFSSTGSFIQAWGWGVSDGASQFETCTTSCESGSDGGGAGQFAYPLGVGVGSSGGVYVAERDSVRIDEFSSTASFTEAWGWGVSLDFGICTTSCRSGGRGGGDGQFSSPEGVAVNTNSGNVYVADYFNNRIDQFSSNGAFIQAWGWGVLDGADQFETCTSSCESGMSGGSAGELSEPNDVAVNTSSGNVYVADSDNNRIDEFSSSGAFIQAWGWGVSDGASQFETCATSCQSGIYGGGAGQFQNPEGIAVDSASGNVYVTDNFEDRIDEFSSSGSFIGAWGWGVNDGGSQLETCTASCQAGLAGGGSGQLNDPDGVAVNSSSENVYVADSHNNRVDEFSSTGSFIEAWGWGVADGANQIETCTTSCQSGIDGGGAGQLSDYAAGLAADGSGNVYVGDADNQRVDEFSSTGGFIQAWGWGVLDGASQLETCTTSCQAGVAGGGSGQFQNPTGLAVNSSSGSLYIADDGDQRIAVFSIAVVPVATNAAVTAGSPTVTYGQDDVTTATVTPSGTACQSGLPNPYCKPRVVNPIVTCGYSPNVSPDIAATGLTTASAGAPVGTYPTSCWGAYAPNYSFSYVSGTLTIQEAPLTVSPDSAVVTRGAPLPKLHWKANFVNHDTGASLSRQPVCAAKVRLDRKGRVVSPPGKYRIRCAGGRDPNYRIRYAAGQLRVVQPHAVHP